MNLEIITIISHITTLFFPFAYFASLRPWREELGVIRAVGTGEWSGIKVSAAKKRELSPPFEINHLLLFFCNAENFNVVFRICII